MKHTFIRRVMPGLAEPTALTAAIFAAILASNATFAATRDSGTNANGSDIVERIIIENKEGRAIEFSKLGDAIPDMNTLTSAAIDVPAKIGRFIVFLTFERETYVYNLVDPREGTVYRTPLNIGEDLSDLSALVGVNLENPIHLSAADYATLSSSTVTTTAVPAGFGGLIGTMTVGSKTIPAFSNGASTYDSGIYDPYGLEYQCTELAVRFYAQVYGRNIRGAGGNAEDYWLNASAHGLTKYANGGKIAPRVGDLVVSIYSIGHIAVVKKVVLPTSTAQGYIIVFQQNWSQTTSDKTLSLSLNNGNYLLAGFSSNYAIEGWVR
jgi:hypothetical protein